MRKLNEVVQYDFQRNTFYKINKETGAESPTYKNGEDLKRFRPDITGHHYLVRRKSERTDAVEAQPKFIKEKSSNAERIIPEYSYFKTLETSRRESKITEASSIMRSTLSNRKTEQKTTPREAKENSFLRMKVEMMPAQLSKQKSNERLNKEMFNQTLSSYTKLLKEKTRQNHSPKKDEYDGSQIAKDPLDTLCTTLSYFRIREPVWEKKGSVTERELQKEPAKLEINIKDMTSKERSLFLQFHPQYKNKVSPKSIEVQVQRKKNLKILEDLFIRTNNRTTRKAYQSIT